MSWKLSGDSWLHECPEVGLITCTREQLNVYFVDKNNRVLDSKATSGKWVYDDPAGCAFCGDLPVELRAVVVIVDKRKEKNGRRKTVDRRGTDVPREVGEPADNEVDS